MRLCEHKLDIVKRALQSDPALSKNAAKVINVYTTDQRGEDRSTGTEALQTAWIKEC